ncbi:MAG: hypothetical protein JST27_11755 [Bacteroidetes bacterium]|nr:hypothetical protein [Bacteroidota bacterium]
MKKFGSALLACLLLACAGISCKKDKSVNLDGHWLFPIAKGTFSLNSLSMFRNVQYHMEITAGDLHQPIETPVSSPGLAFNFIGPAKVPITDCIARIDVDTFSFSGVLTNQFPVTIGAGTLLVLRTSPDTTTNTNIAGFATVQNDIPPGSPYNFQVFIKDKILGDFVYLFLEHFSTPAFSNVRFHTQPSSLDIKIEVLKASYLELFSNRECLSEDTTEIDFNGQDQSASQTNGSLSDTAMSGNINAFGENSLPISARFQLYFLSSDKTKALDSLFPSGPFQVEPGSTDNTGNPVFTSRNKTSIPISRNKLNRIKQASYVASHLYMSTMGMSGPVQKANKSASLQLQLTGDLRLKIRF